MRVEWAVLCQRDQKSSNAGWDLESVGRSGVMIDAPVSEAGFIAFLCLRIDEADGVSASVASPRGAVLSPSRTCLPARTGGRVPNRGLGWGQRVDRVAVVRVDP